LLFYRVIIFAVLVNPSFCFFTFANKLCDTLHLLIFLVY